MVSWIKVTDIQYIIERSGELIKEVYDKRNFNVELKGDNTPVTEADKISSEYITSALILWMVQRNLYIGMGVFVSIWLLWKRENLYSG